MSHHNETASSNPWEVFMGGAAEDHLAWIQTLTQRVAEHGIEAVVQRYRNDEVSANELFHCLIIADEFPEEFVTLACELVPSREGSSVGREFLKKSRSESAVPALRQLLGSFDLNDVYWALNALQEIRCQASIDAVRDFENHAEPLDPNHSTEFNFLEGQRQETLDALTQKEKPSREHVRDDLREALQQRGAEAVVEEALEGRHPVDEVFIALRELADFPANAVSLALKLGTDRTLASYKRRDAIYFVCEYRGDDAESLQFRALEAQLEIHFGGGDAWGEGCCLMEAIGASGSEKAIPSMEAIDLTRSGAANLFTADLEESRQAALELLQERFGASAAL